MKPINILELFGGIGALTKAFKNLGIPYKVIDYVEIDKYAVNSYNAMNGTDFKPQDICEWDKDIKVDLIMHGSPCQDFSLAGKQLGGDKDSGTRSSLMYETIRIVNKLKPKYVIWENVKNVISKKHKHNFDNYINELNQLGYTSYYQVLNAKNYGIPQNRERVFVVSILGEHTEFIFPQPKELKLKLKDLLESDVDEKYYLSGEIINKITNHEIEECEDHFNIKNNNKRGYLEATDGDGCYITNIDKKRGTVQKELIPTLKASPDIGVVVNDNNRTSYK